MHPKCIAVGECGLDYFRLPNEQNKKNKTILLQKDIFIAQIKLAKKFNKPLIVHIRDANDDSKTILLQHEASKIGGVLHCFNASPHLLELANNNFYFGIGGIITFKNAKNLTKILPKIPKDKLLVETDAPYLAPHPFRGKRNEPQYTTFVIEKIANILNISIKNAQDITTNNAKKLFKEFGAVSV